MHKAHLKANVAELHLLLEVDDVQMWVKPLSSGVKWQHRAHWGYSKKENVVMFHQFAQKPPWTDLHQI